MANKVLASSTIKTFVSGGREVALKYATETDSWKRYKLSPDTQEKYAKAMEKADVPAGATTAILT